MTTIIKTKFGNARLCYDGYYKITTRKEGNHNKQLHRVIYEDYYKCTILPNGVIHHKDENRANNDIENLELMDKIDHIRLHKKGNNFGYVGENHPFYGEHHSDEDMKRMSQMKSNTGYFRVSKGKKKDVKQGFIWQYQYYNEEGKRKKIVSVNLKDLKDKVIGKGLEWAIIDMGLAMECGLV